MSPNSILRAALIAAVLSLTSCSGSTGKAAPEGLTDLPTAPRQLPPLEGADLYLSKRAIKDIDFEQYKIGAGKLYRECGKIRRGRQVVEKQQTFDVSQSDLEPLKSAVDELYQAMEASRATFEEPGHSNAVWDPGQLILGVKISNRTREIKTSVDSIASPVNIPAQKLKSVIMELREIGKGEECPNPKFYGISSTIQQEGPNG